MNNGSMPTKHHGRIWSGSPLPFTDGTEVPHQKVMKEIARNKIYKYWKGRYKTITFGNISNYFWKNPIMSGTTNSKISTHRIYKDLDMKESI